LLIDRIARLRDSKDSPEETFPLRRIAYLAVAAALIPIVPTPIPANAAPVTPAFITSGAWKQYVPAGHALVPVPDTSPGDPVAMVWLAESGGGFRLPGGYFIGPGADGRGVYGASPVRPTTEVLQEVASTGYAPAVTERMRQDLRADLAFWRASALVMPDNVKHAEIVRHFVDQLTGRTGTRVQDVTVWDTLDLAAPGS
jgi:dolichyl-phosphate beta-glucosyltransferase